jgi:hypothetical protein
LWKICSVGEHEPEKAKAAEYFDRALEVARKTDTADAAAICEAVRA